MCSFRYVFDWDRVRYGSQTQDGNRLMPFNRFHHTPAAAAATQPFPWQTRGKYSFFEKNDNDPPSNDKINNKCWVNWIRWIKTAHVVISRFPGKRGPLYHLCLRNFLFLSLSSTFLFSSFNFFVSFSSMLLFTVKCVRCYLVFSAINQQETSVVLNL